MVRGTGETKAETIGRVRGVVRGGQGGGGREGGEKKEKRGGLGVDKKGEGTGKKGIWGQVASGAGVVRGG